MRRAAAALALGAFVAGCSLLLPEPEAPAAPQPQPMPGVPRPDGPSVVIGQGVIEGQAWTMSAFRSGDDVCTVTAFAGQGGGGSACGLVPGPGSSFGMVGSSSGTGSPTLVEGMVSADVTFVRVEARGGVFAEAAVLSLAPLGLPGGAFVVGFPEGTDPLAVVAIDGGGRQIERFPLAGPP